MSVRSSDPDLVAKLATSYAKDIEAAYQRAMKLRAALDEIPKSGDKQ